MNKIFYNIFIMLLFFFPLSSFAQELYISAPETVKTGETFEVSVRLDTENVLINSASASIEYDKNIFTFGGYKSEEGVLKLWVSPPKDSSKDKEGVITWSGIIPGGVAGEFNPSKSKLQDVTLVNLLFVANGTGQGEFSFIDSQVLKHDGKGSFFTHTRAGATVVVLDGPADNTTHDAAKPESFTITFIDAGFFSRTPSMLMFFATDDESGIKEYQVKVGIGNWKVGESPYAIAKGVFQKNVTVRAVDYGGNFEEASITIPGFITTKALAGIILIILLCIGAIKMIK